MTFQEITNAHKGYISKQIEGWRKTRWLATVVANAAGHNKKPSDLLKLPEDGEGATVNEEIEKLKEMRKWRAAGQQ
jgi:hypothetical protein